MRYKNNTKHVQKIKISHDIKSIYKEGLKTRMRNFLHYLRQDVWKFFKKFYFVCKVVFKCSFRFFCSSIYHFLYNFYLSLCLISGVRKYENVFYTIFLLIFQILFIYWFFSSKSDKKWCWVTNFVKATLMWYYKWELVIHFLVFL